MTLRAYGEMTRQCKPGDLITVTGIFLPIRYEGYRAVRAGLTADTYVEVTYMVPAKQSYSEYQLTPELEAEVRQRCHDTASSYWHMHQCLPHAHTYDQLYHMHI